MNLLNTTVDTKLGTIAEINGNLIHVENESSPAINEVAANNITLYPSIRYKQVEDLKPDYVYTAAKSSSSMVDTYYNDIKSTLSQQWQEKFPMIAATPLYKQGKRIYDYIYSTYLKPSDAILEHPKFNSNKDTVVYMAWHPHQDILAIVDKHDDVYIYEKHDTVWTCQVLRDIQMKDVTALEWKHRSAGTLAVGCKQGVCVWTIPRVATDQEPQFHPSASMVYLSYQGHDHVSSLAWDPTPGSHLLAVGSAVSNALVIYDMLLKRTHVLKRYGHGCIMLRWSPNGEWLFEGGSIGTSRMWDTKHWESKVISNPPGLWVQAACWAPDNRSLVFSMYGKSDLHVLFMSGKQIHSVVDHPLASLPVTTVTTESGEQIKAGGVIRDISLDGSRLAIAFENTPLIALYSLKQDSPLNLNTEPILFPIGYVHGSSVCMDNTAMSVTAIDSQPLGISFCKNHKQGSVMAILWKHGLVTFVTHKYLTNEEVRKRFY